ncbi:MAG: flagellar type III secretion system pore protein FliP [Clostridium sp.]|nr:flagellar type III secretion system pore protein FliP [Clostridium sp.]
MKKRLLSGQQIAIWVCLLVSVGILCMGVSLSVYAAEPVTPPAPSTPGTPGATAPVPPEGTDVASGLNLANELTVTYLNGNGELNSSLKILLTLTLMALAPTLIMMMTSFTRIIIVLHFTRAALNTQTAPPNQVLIGLALILTFFIMSPTVEQVYEEAYVPFDAGEIDQEEALDRAITPMREFMSRHTQAKDVGLFMEIAGQEWDVGDPESVPISVLIPSFMVSELRIAFFIGFMIYIPFIVIDMVVASTLMSMGMMMLPPTTISMPFKILLFVLADGWGLIIGSVVKMYR